jgi:hypothetical protein
MRTWSVGEIQWVNGGDFSEWGFVLYDQSGKPCVAFKYSRGVDARAGHDHVQAALVRVAAVSAWDSVTRQN